MDKPDFSKIEALYEAKKDVFDRFCALLKEYNKRFNLTSITDDEEIKYKHFYDSLAGAEYFKENARVVEIGSGGGFPSLPLKIVRNDLFFTLVESTGKKCEFLRTAVKELGLNGVEVKNCRCEELATDKAYRENFDIVCARAVARLNTLCEYCLPFLKQGGRFIAYKGEAREEIEEARRAASILGGGKIESVEYRLYGFGARTLVLIEKEKNTPAQYPRGHGKERSNPIV